MTSLNGTLPFPKVDNIPKLVSHNLEFDMTSSFDQFLQIYISITERRF